MIAVGYEQTKGIRKASQRTDGLFNVSISKVFQVLISKLYKIWTDKEGMRGIMLNVSKDILRLFENSPIHFETELVGNFDYIHIFVINKENLRSEFLKVKDCLKPDGLLWVSWPKGGELGTDLNANKVRDIGLSAGLVDVKVAAINDTWSGLKFVFRVRDRKNIIQ